MADSGISERDLWRLLDVVCAETPAAPGKELPEPVLTRLGELVPCLFVSFFVMDTRRGRTLASQEVDFGDLADDTEETDSEFFKLYWQCIACSYPERSGVYARVSTWRDFYSEREYANLGMGSHQRAMGCWDELLVCLPPVGGVQRRLMLGRAPDDVPFTERDRLLLALLRPHLVSLRDRVEADRQTPDLTPRQRELLMLVAGGGTNRQVARALGVSEGTVRKHLENIYDRLGVSSRTAAVARLGSYLTTDG